MSKENKLYKVVEGMLYSYPQIEAEIHDIQLDIDMLQCEYKGISAISYSENTGSSNSKSSAVENEIVSKQSKIDYLTSLKRSKEIELSKIDNMLSILKDNERQLIKLRYIKKMQFKDIANIMYMNEVYLICLRKKIIKEKLIPFIENKEKLRFN